MTTVVRELPPTSAPARHTANSLWPLAGSHKGPSPLALAVNPEWLGEGTDYQEFTTFYCNYHLLKGETAPFLFSVSSFLS